LLDSFFDLKSGKSHGFASTSTTSTGFSMSLKDGKFVFEVDIQEFDPEDIDIRVEKGKLILQGEREVRRGNSFSKRHFNQRLELPEGVDVDNMFSEVRSGGRLVITAPQIKKAVVGKEDEGTKEVTKKAETTTTTSEGEVDLEGGGKARTSSTATSGKKQQTTSTKKDLGGGSFEEEIVEEEEFFEETSTTSSSTMTFEGGDMSSFGGDFGNLGKSLLGKMGSLGMDMGGMELSLPSFGSGLGKGVAGDTMGGTSKTTSSSTEERVKTAAGQVVEMSKREGTTTDVKEMTIPIAINKDGKAGAPKTPKPRELPFDFGATEEAKTTESQQQEVHAEFFVPLKNIGDVKKNALADATAMAKRKGDNFELVVNIQRFTPEQVKVYASGQSVIVSAKNVAEDGFVTDDYEQKFSLPDDVDTSRLTSGISKDGILMIRVPRKRDLERFIPIQYDAKLGALEKALKKSVQGMEVKSSEEIRTELAKEQIEPLKIEKEEDAVKAASAEVIEAMTVGAAEEAGREAGEEAGAQAASAAAVAKVQEAVAKAVAETAKAVGQEIAGELGAAAAIQAATAVGVEAGKQAALQAGANVRENSMESLLDNDKITS